MAMYKVLSVEFTAGRRTRRALGSTLTVRVGSRAQLHVRCSPWSTQQGEQQLLSPVERPVLTNCVSAQLYCQHA